MNDEKLYTVADLVQARKQAADDERARCIAEIKDWCESEDDGDTSFNAGMGEAIRVIAALGPIGETRGETRPVPTDKARELATKIRKECYEHSNGGDYSGESAFDEDEAANIIVSALTQARGEVLREAADKLCRHCDRNANYDEEEWKRCPGCSQRAAILGKEVSHE